MFLLLVLGLAFLVVLDGGIKTGVPYKQVYALKGKQVKNVKLLMGEPRRIFENPKEFESTWTAMVAEDCISPKTYPTATSEVWLYQKRPDGRLNPCEKFWLIYFTKQGKVERIVETGGWW